MKYFTQVIIILMYCTSATNLHAQTKLGIKAGTQLSNLDAIDKQVVAENNIFDYQPKLGYHFGVYTQFQLNKTFFIQPEINWSQKGGRLSSNRSLRYNYLSPTLLVGLKPMDKFTLLVGVDRSYLFSAYTTNSQQVQQNHTKDWDTSIILGVEYQLKDKFNIGLQAKYGLNTVLDVTDRLWSWQQANGDRLIFRNLALQFYVSYKIL